MEIISRKDNTKPFFYKNQFLSSTSQNLIAKFLCILQAVIIVESYVKVSYFEHPVPYFIYSLLANKTNCKAQATWQTTSSSFL